MNKELEPAPSEAHEPAATGASELTTLPRALIVRSKTNPRTHFDEAYIKELAESIREHGLLQPILVRPLPGSRLEETFEDRQPGDPLPTHEIICGECRWRAAGVAGVERMHVLVRHLDDLQVLQVQLVENLKRQDLHPLEEAEGYERLVKDHGLTIADIAARVGKSESFVYKAMKLLELTPECRTELYAGKLTQSTALLVARQPAYLQKQIANAIMQPQGMDGEPMSFRQAARHIQQHYMLRVADAIFDIKSADLVPKAGPCTTCPKNTGCMKDLFGDVSTGDMCTDPKCFDSKKVAHHEAIAKAAAAKGQKVIQGKEAKEILPSEYSQPKGHRKADERVQLATGGATTLRKLARDEGVQPVILMNPHTKQAEEIIPDDVATKLIKAAQAKSAAAKKEKEAEREPTKEELEESFKKAWQTRALEQLHAAVTSGPTPGITVLVAREIAKRYTVDLYADDAEIFIRLFGIPDAKVGQGDAITHWLDTCPDAMVGPALLVGMALDELIHAFGRAAEEWPVLNMLARDAGVDVKTIQAQVKADMKREAAERKAAKELAAKPAAPAKGKSKTTAADAKAGISKALQEVADVIPIVGDTVRVKDGLKGPGGKLRKCCGKSGRIASRIMAGDSDDWMVEIDGGDSVRLARDEFVVLMPAAEAKKPVADDAKIPLKDGTTLDPVAAWPFPTKSKATTKGARA